MNTNTPISVCHLISGDLWAGAEVQVYNLLVGFLKVPTIKVSAIVYNEGELAEKLRGHGIEVFVLDEKLLGFFSLLKETKIILKKLSPSILHSHRYKENIISGILKPFFPKMMLVQTIHGLSEPFVGLKRIKMWVYQTINNLITKTSFKAIIAVSSDISQRTTRNFKKPRSYIIHNSVTFDQEPVSNDPLQTKLELGIPASANVIGSVGRLSPIKNFEMLLEAAKIILDSNKNSYFIIVGDGELRLSLLNQAKRLNISDKVIFTGFRGDAKRLISCFDIFVISSLHEGIPTALLEAMYLEKAVVCSCVGGIPEVITTDETGLLFESKNTEQLAQYCKKLIADPKLRQRLASNAKQHVEANFSSNQQVAKHVKTYQEICA